MLRPTGTLGLQWSKGNSVVAADLYLFGSAAGAVVFGVGDQGRILEIENMYAQPKSKNPDYRVIPLVVKIEVDGDTFTFELQLTTRRTSVAADVEHNTLFKEYHDLTEEQRQMIKKMQSEAAALDQEETRK